MTRVIFAIRRLLSVPSHVSANRTNQLPYALQPSLVYQPIILYLRLIPANHFTALTNNRSSHLPSPPFIPKMSCPDCFSGHVHAGTPTGKTTKLHGLDVYVAEPTESSTPPKGIIIIIPDAFGWEFVNNRILADHYADRGGYLVYLPEFMNGII